jgi:hypothetical protein
MLRYMQLNGFALKFRERAQLFPQCRCFYREDGYGGATTAAADRAGYLFAEC